MNIKNLIKYLLIVVILFLVLFFIYKIYEIRNNYAKDNDSQIKQIDRSVQQNKMLVSGVKKIVDDQNSTIYELSGIVKSLPTLNSDGYYSIELAVQKSVFVVILGKTDYNVGFRISKNGETNIKYKIKRVSEVIENIKINNSISLNFVTKSNYDLTTMGTACNTQCSDSIIRVKNFGQEDENLFNRYSEINLPELIKINNLASQIIIFD